MWDQFIVLDVETSSLDFLTGKIICLGIKVNGEGPKVIFKQIPKDIINILESPEYLKIGHNISFDIKFLRNSGVNIVGPYFDTKIAYFQYHPFEPLGLKDILSKMGWKIKRFQDVIGKGKNKKKLEEVDQEVLSRYCKQDVLGSYEIYNRYKNKISSWTEFIEFPLIDLIINMESRGLFLDQKQIRKLEKIFIERIVDLELKFPGINLRSPLQVRNFLISRGYSKDLSRYVANTEVISTGRLVLKSLSNTVPICKDILQHREFSKLISTYILKMKDKNILTGSFNQCGTRSGRISSSSPNLQNIPIRTEYGKMIRKCIISRPGYKFILGDLSQIEPRLISFFSQDSKLLEIFNSGKDFHTEVTQEIFNKREVTKDERFIGKTVGLATLYGAGVDTLFDVLVGYGVEISKIRVREIRETIIQAFPRISYWSSNEIYKVNKIGYIDTLGGRRIVLPKKYINIINYKIQGSAADIMKLILLNLYFLGYSVLASVHDEVVVEVKESEEYKKEEVKNIMERSFSLKDTPIVADVKVANSWGDK